MSRVVSALEKNKAGVFGTGVTMENTVAIREEPAEKTTVEPEREGVRVGPHAQLAGELSKWKGGKRGCHRGECSRSAGEREERQCGWSERKE